MLDEPITLNTICPIVILHHFMQLKLDFNGNNIFSDEVSWLN